MAEENKAFQQIIYENPAPNVARIVMNRPERANAQGITMTYELDAAFKRACADESIGAIIFAGAGDNWNAGHDLSGEDGPMPAPGQVVGLWGEYGGPGWEGYYSREREVYLEISERWRNAPKPVIGEIQGAVISGGIILSWICDMIVCSEDARFRDATAVEMGICGVELWQHPFEMSARQAKEWLMTGGWMGAQEAKERGMVNHVVPRDQLSTKAFDLAKTVAANNKLTNKMVKQAVNFAQDQMGRKASSDFGFHLHQIGHMQAMLNHGVPVDLDSLPPKMRATLEKAISKYSVPAE